MLIANLCCSEVSKISLLQVNGLQHFSRMNDNNDDSGDNDEDHNDSSWILSSIGLVVEKLHNGIRILQIEEYFLLGYDAVYGGDTFLRNVGYHSTHYTASYPRRKYSSKPPLWKPQILHCKLIHCRTVSDKTQFSQATSPLCENF
jgi:hypothetical protein